MSQPLVSVLMSVYNGAAFLETAVSSILSQTFTNFEFIIINDGSTDNSPAILNQFTDPRLKVIHQPNQGLTRALNNGLRRCNGRYIARMDTDDIALPQRLQKQTDYILSHPDVVVVGTGYRQQDTRLHKNQDVILPQHDADIRRAMGKGNPFCHPSVMMQKEAVLAAGGYDETFRYTQDYELWSRLARYGRFYNLPDILLIRRFHPHSLSNNLRLELYRLWLFMRANNLAIRRLRLPWYNHLYTLSALHFIPLDIYKALKAQFTIND